MGKRNTVKAKRSLGALPKGLPQRKGGSMKDPGNPFENATRMKRPKYEVHNRPLSKPKNTKHRLETMQRRQTELRKTLASTKKSNVMIDRRIGQYDNTMSTEDQMLARLVKERTRRSQKSAKYRLDDDNEQLLTHKGRTLDPNKSEAIYSDDEDDNGDLEAVDTELHFGGSNMQQKDPYGSSSMATLSQVYGQRKTELDDLIARRKFIKAEKVKGREEQVETVEKLDENFAELSSMLLYRKNQPPPKVKPPETKEEQEMKEWNAEMKAMMFKPKSKATDRTKTPEEIAKEEAERLHELETRRLARMNGDFEEDDLSDISTGGRKSKRRKTKDSRARNPDELSSDEEDGGERKEPEPVFTADGLKYVDADGNYVEEDENDEEGDDESDSASDDETSAHPLPKGTKVKGNYRVAEQYGERTAWYDGTITKVHVSHDGSIRYDVEYNDGDFEEDMLPQNVKPVEKTTEEKEEQSKADKEKKEMVLKRSIARNKARREIPYVFSVPTTLESLNDLIAKYAATGQDATTIIERIHRANSVRLDHRNTEKMQNFYDALLRRFILVGDAISISGNGGEELGRLEQLSGITRVLYAMTTDSPEMAAAVWSRRVGILQSAHEKRLRDFEVMVDEEESPWPSSGVFLLLKALTVIFPVTDKRHDIVTPANLLLGEIISQTPVTSTHDIILGVLFSALLLENGLEAKRVAPEALGFLASVIRLFSDSPGHCALPALDAATILPDVQGLREALKELTQTDGDEDSVIPPLRLEQDFAQGDASLVATALLGSTLKLIGKLFMEFEASLPDGSVSEMMGEVSDSLLTLKASNLTKSLKRILTPLASGLAKATAAHRVPLRRRAGDASEDKGIKSLAPRMEDPEKYTLSRDKGKKAKQAAVDRTRREYKREHKAFSRELRIDASFIESERRKQYQTKQDKERAKRNKNFAWLEGEQAAMNQQVAQGGGLLKGGGMGAAKAKAKSGKLGIKKGGKF